MATVRTEAVIDVPPDVAWDALRDFGAVHERLVPGFVVDARLEGEDRVVTFFNGAVARERFVDADDERRRLVWTVAESPLGLTHHNGAAQMEAADAGRTRFTWTADVLPHDAAPLVRELMERGTAALKATLEGR